MVNTESNHLEAAQLRIQLQSAGVNLLVKFSGTFHFF